MNAELSIKVAIFPYFLNIFSKIIIKLLFFCIVCVDLINRIKEMWLQS